MNRTKAFAWLSAVICALINVSCDKDEMEFPVPDHHVLVYMVADNNLSDTGYDNLEDITSAWEQMEFHDDATLFVYMDPSTGEDTRPRLIRFGETEEHQVTFFEESNAVDQTIIRKICRNVFDTGKRKQPINTLVLWSHGTGWIPKEFSSSRSFGEDNGSKIDIDDLAVALEGLCIDNLLFDACMMGSAELAAELNGIVKQMVASPAEVLAAGFPYARIIPELCIAEPDLKRVIDHYHDYYDSQTGKYRSGILALYDLTHMEELSEAYHQLLYLANGYQATADVPRLCYDRFKTPLLYDIRMNAEILRDKAAEKIGEADAEKCMKAFEKALTDVIVYCKHTPAFMGYSLKDACGMSVFVPNRQSASLLDSFYKDLTWYK